MTWLGPAIAFVFGCTVGSFLNVCVFRLPRNCLSIGRPTFSFCPACGKTIAPYDNIPIFSYLILRGRCRHCGIGISPRYLLIEIMTGILFSVFFYRFATGNDGVPLFVIYTVLACALFVASFIDFDFLIIPDSLTLGGLCVGILLSIVFPSLHAPMLGESHVEWNLIPRLAHAVVDPLAPASIRAATLPHVESLMRSVAGALTGGLLTYLMGAAGKAIFRKDAMGFGDVKLMAMIGSLLGWRLAVATFFLAPFFGLIMGIASILRSGNHVIPYGPFLSLAAIVCILYQRVVLEYIRDYEMLAQAILEAVHR